MFYYEVQLCPNHFLAILQSVACARISVMGRFFLYFICPLIPQKPAEWLES